LNSRPLLMERRERSTRQFCLDRFTLNKTAKKLSSNVGGQRIPI